MEARLDRTSTGFVVLLGDVVVMGFDVQDPIITMRHRNPRKRPSNAAIKVWNQCPGEIHDSYSSNSISLKTAVWLFQQFGLDPDPLLKRAKDMGWNIDAATSS